MPHVLSLFTYQHQNLVSAQCNTAGSYQERVMV